MQNTQEFIDPGFLNNPYEKESRQSSSPEPKTQAGLWSKISSILFLVSLFVLPFVFVPIAGWSVVVGKVVLVSLLGLSAGAMVLGSVMGKTLAVPKISSALTLGIFLLAAISLVFSESIAHSVFGANLEAGTFLTTAVAVMLAFIAPLALSTRQNLFMSLVAVLAGAMVLALFHIIRFIFGPDVLAFGHFFDPAMSLVGSWYDLGVFFGIIYLISLSALVFGSFPSTIRTLLVVMLGVSLVFVGLVKLPVLSITLVLVTLAILGATFVTRGKSMATPIFASLGAFLLFFILSLQIVPIDTVEGVPVERFYASPTSLFVENVLGVYQGEIRPTWSNTQQMVGEGLSSAKNIAVGKGPNTFSYLWQESRVQEVIDSDYWWSLDFQFAGGIIPTFVVTYGLLFVAAILAFVGYLTMGVVRAILRRDSDPVLSSVAIASGVAAIFLWILSVVYVFSVVPYLLMFILSGIAMAALAQMKQVETFHISGRNPLGTTASLVVAVICVVLILPMFVISTSRTLYGQGVAMVQTAEELPTLELAQVKIRQAAELERNDSFARIETEIGLLHLQELLSLEELPAGYSEERLEQIVRGVEASAARAITINPRNYLNYMSAGLAYETLGLLGLGDAYGVAEGMYRAATTLNPTNPALPLMSARLEILRENNEEAVAYANQSLEIKFNYPDAYLFLEDVALAEGNVALAIEHLEAAVEALPGNVFFLNELGVLHYAEEEYDEAIARFTESLSIESQNANALFFRALSNVYGNEDNTAALRDLEIVIRNNTEDERLATIVDNIRAGDDPLEGVDFEESEIVPNESDVPTTNVDAARDLEDGDDPIGGASVDAPSTNTNTDTPPSSEGDTEEVEE